MIYGHTGIGTFANIIMQQVSKKEGVRFCPMPFKGGTEIVAALLGGHITAMTGDVNYSLVEAGQTRLLPSSPRPVLVNIPKLRF